MTSSNIQKMYRYLIKVTDHRLQYYAYHPNILGYWWRYGMDVYQRDYPSCLNPILVLLMLNLLPDDLQWLNTITDIEKQRVLESQATQKIFIKWSHKIQKFHAHYNTYVTKMKIKDNYCKVSLKQSLSYAIILTNLLNYKLIHNLVNNFTGLINEDLSLCVNYKDIYLSKLL